MPASVISFPSAIFTFPSAIHSVLRLLHTIFVLLILSVKQLLYYILTLRMHNTTAEKNKLLRVKILTPSKLIKSP